jgi:hypothetical protein
MTQIQWMVRLMINGGVLLVLILVFQLLPFSMLKQLKAFAK